MNASQFVVMDKACLRARENNEIAFYLGGLAYASADELPADFLASHALAPPISAAQYVTQAMQFRFGPDPGRWPDVAVKFVQWG